ncbi:hypothetical protein [Nocardia sp. bgisy134]|uniref:hypothetical protein n=1 Tax=Nocardia sp. bgisy134 TaxID=3413789 RepID=UPI003D714ADE
MSLPGLGFFENYTFGENMFHSLTNWIAGEDIEAGTRPGDVQGRFNQQREAVRGRASEIGFVGDYKSGIKSREDYEAPLEQLREKVEKIDLTAVNDLKTAWEQIGSRTADAQKAFDLEMQRALNANVWHGKSAAAAADGVATFLSSASKASQAAQLMAKKVDELYTGLAPTLQLVPHVPEHNTNWENTRRWIAGRGWRDNEEAYNTAWAEAKRVLRTVYDPVLRETDRVPVIPKPHNPTANNVDPGQNDGGRPRGTSTGVQPGGTNDGGQPTTNDDTTQSGETEDPSQGQQNSQQQQSNDDTQAASTETPTTPTGTTAPASASPTSPTTPTAPGTPGTPGFPGGPGGPGPGGPGTPTGRPGSSVPGMPGIPGGANPAATRPAAANARTGMSGMPGMGAPGARGKGDDESTKGIPDYLITQEHGDELTGLTDAPKTVPPVIGE